MSIVWFWNQIESIIFDVNNTQCIVHGVQGIKFDMKIEYTQHQMDTMIFDANQLEIKTNIGPLKELEIPTGDGGRAKVK